MAARRQLSRQSSRRPSGHPSRRTPRSSAALSGEVQACVPALFGEDHGLGAVRCLVCPHECVIQEDKEGLCKARGCRDGRLVSLTYARPASVISDEIEKKPFFHFHPGTRALSLGCHGCNVLCSGCQNWQISHANPCTETVRLPVLQPDAAVAMARKHKLMGVVFTYNDPVVWIEYVHDVCAAFKAAGLYTAFVTAAYLHEAALDYVAPVLDAFKFDLKAPTGEGWGWLTKVNDSLQGRAMAVRARELHGCHVEVVSNIVPGLNDSDDSLRTMAEQVLADLGPKTPWHVTRFSPDFELSYIAPTPIKTLERGIALGKKVGLQFVYIGNVQGHPARNTVCPNCGRTVIERGEVKVDPLWVTDGRCATCGEELNIIHKAND